MSGQHRPQDEQEGGAGGGGPQGWSRRSVVSPFTIKPLGQDIWWSGHLRQGVQLPPAGVRHQRHHRQPQVRGVGTQREAGPGDQRDQGPGLPLHLQLYSPYWESDKISSW